MPSLLWRTCGAARASRLPLWSAWPRRMRTARSGSVAGKPYGRCGRSAVSRSPRFAAADKRRGSLLPEVEEERVELAPMKAGREVVEDYRSRGLTLRSHPVAFLRG